MMNSHSPGESGSVDLRTLGVTLLALFVAAIAMAVLHVRLSKAAADARLRDAAVAADDKRVRAALSDGGNPNAVNAEGHSALDLAVQVQSLECTDILLRAGAKADHKDSAGQTPFDIAISRGNARIVAMLLKHGGDPNELANARQAALILAARAADIATVAELLRLGANINEPWKKEGTNRTAIHWTCDNGDPDTTAFLIAHGADVNATSGKAGMGSTPLMFAVVARSVKTVRLLLDHGARVDVRNRTSGMTALDMAARRGPGGPPSNEIQRLLLSPPNRPLRPGLSRSL